MDNPRVSIVILNWNGWEDTIECLESVFQINYPNFDVIVVDNASKDDSLEKIREYCSGNLKVESDFFKYNTDNKPIIVSEFREKFENIQIPINTEKSTSRRLYLIKNNENYGFPGGNNVGIKFALKFFNPNYILLLNNDTIADTYLLTELVKNGESNENIGILGPKIYYYDDSNVIYSVGCKVSWKFSRGINLGCNELDIGQYNEEKEVESISGCSFFIKTDVIKKIGLMDETFFLYFEETDWALRASLLGYKNVYVPKAKIWHKVSKSTGGISNPIGLYYIERNRWLFMKKWAQKRDYLFFMTYQFVSSLFMPLTMSIYFKNRKLFSAYYRGMIEGMLFQWEIKKK